MKLQKKILLILLVLILVLIFTPVFGVFYKNYFGPVSSGFWGPQKPENISGFFISYSFFVVLFVVLFSKRGKCIKSLMAFILPLLFLFGVWEDLIINIIAAALGFVLGGLGLLIYKKVKNK